MARLALATLCRVKLAHTAATSPGPAASLPRTLVPDTHSVPVAALAPSRTRAVAPVRHSSTVTLAAPLAGALVRATLLVGPRSYENAPLRLIARPRNSVHTTLQSASTAIALTLIALDDIHSVRALPLTPTRPAMLAAVGPRIPVSVVLHAPVQGMFLALTSLSAPTP